MKTLLMTSALALSLTGAAFAQDTGPNAAGPAPTAQAPEAPTAPKTPADLGISADELKKMGTLNSSLPALVEQHRAGIDAAASQEARLPLQTAMNEALAKAITDTGLTVDRYNEITNLANQNPAVGGAIAENDPAIRTAAAPTATGANAAAPATSGPRGDAATANPAPAPGSPAGVPVN